MNVGVSVWSSKDSLPRIMYRQGTPACLIHFVFPFMFTFFNF
nr:MAG TPA: hypothetical protein [Caudoviricetes sp.]